MRALLPLALLLVLGCARAPVVAPPPAPAALPGLGQPCGGLAVGDGSPQCAEGLVCCFPPTGAAQQRPQASCLTPCGPSEPFCQAGCSSPPVP